MATKPRSGKDGSGVILARQTAQGTPVRTNDPPFESHAATETILDDAAVDATGALSGLAAFKGVGPIKITNSAAGAGVYTVSGKDESGASISDTLTFQASDTEKTTTDNYVSDSLTITVATAFASGRTADITVATIDLHVAGPVQKIFPGSSIDVGPNADVQESDLITAQEADTPNEIGQYWSTFDLTTRVLIEDIAHFLRGYFNPAGYIISTALPTVDALATQSTNPDGDLTIPDANKIAKHGALTSPAIPAANWPGKLRLILTGSPTFASDARMRIVGYRGIGRPDVDRFYTVENVLLNEVMETSEHSFRTITGVNIEGVTNATSHRLVWVPDVYVTVFEYRRPDVEFPGFTVVPLQGGAPGLMQDFKPNQMTIEANASRIQFSYQGPGSRYDELLAFEGGDSEQLLIPQTDYDDHFPTAPLRAYKGALGAFSFGDDIVKYSDVNITLNRNYEPDPGVDGSAFRRGVEASRTRQNLFNITTRFRSGEQAGDVFTRWQKVFRNEDRLKLALRMYDFDRFGQQRRVDVESPASQLLEDPRTPVTGPGSINRRLPFKALPRDGMNESEIKFILYTSAAYTEA